MSIDLVMCITILSIFIVLFYDTPIAKIILKFIIIPIFLLLIIAIFIVFIKFVWVMAPF